jgi:hypothetical protein
MNWFGKSKKEQKSEGTDSVDGFKDFLDKSIREEKTEVVQNKRQDSRIKAMARVLVDNGYTVDEINSLCRSKRVFHLVDGHIEEKK